MALGLIGRKRGMTRIFDENGVSIPVTVVEAGPCRITQVKTPDTDGYRAVQCAVGSKRQSLVNKPLAGHYAKAGVDAGEGLWEFRLEGDEGADLEVGGELKVDFFEAGQMVDVAGTTRGKGFAGTVKRHNFATQDATHGNSLAHRVPGSIGQCQTPGRVFKGKKMPGQMGNTRTTVQNLEVVRVDSERNLLLIRGAVPGSPGTDLIIRPAMKQARAS
jgi:large subunit ribosomal protein L3